MAKADQLDFLLKASIIAIVKNPTGGDEKRYFESVFPIDEEAAKMPWFVLSNFLAPKFLNETLGPQGQGWVKIYETKTLKLINRKNPLDISAIPLRVMTEDQLKIYVTRWELPIKLADFHDIATMRQFITLFQKDPKGYQVQYRSYMEGKGRKYPELDRFRKQYQSSSPVLESEFDELEKKYEGAPIPPAPKDPFSATMPNGDPVPVSQTLNPAPEVQTAPSVQTEPTPPADDPFGGV